MNLRNVDLNLLLVFDAVYAARNITRAADKLGLSQPATSNALNRLRQFLGDPLFERTSSGMEPTPEAHRIAPILHDALNSIETALGPADKTLQLEKMQREFFLLMPDSMDPVLMPALIARTALAAPGVTYRLQPIQDLDIERAIAERKFDLGVIPFDIQHDAIKTSFLGEDEIYIVARAGHPKFGHLTQLRAEDLVDAVYIGVPQALHRLAHLDKIISTKNRTSIACTATRLGSIPYMVGSTDLIAPLTRRFAQSVAASNGLKVFESPVSLPAVNWTLAWRAEFDGDPALRWLREQITEIFADSG
ncbi:MAG: LysR family transcriptional regulator [Alphaproteobacteria bacterium]|nr:LysR family transcriptional regulator [Alphaproteobacteria bacterium]